MLMGVGVILLSPFIPILLNVAKENANDRIRRHSKSPRTQQKLNEWIGRKKEIKTELSRFTRVDLGLELIYQISLQLILVLLSKSETPTTGGLEVLFEQTGAFGMSGSTIIILLTCWSFKTCILLQRKAIKTEKVFVPFTSTLVILFWSTVAAGRRIMAIIVFFLPSLGLFSILNHWKAEQLPFKVRLDSVNEMTPDDIVELNKMIRNVSWSSLDNWIYNTTHPDESQPPHYTLYTGLALGQTFIVFLEMMTLQLLAITVVKIRTVRRQENWFNMLVHILENLNIPFPYKDWDTEDNLTVDEFKQRLREVNIEMAWTFVLNNVFSVLMFCPFWWTGMR